MKNKIGKKHKTTFERCQGKCNTCFNDGDCQLQKMIKKYGMTKIKELVYNEEIKDKKVKESINKVGRPKKVKRRGRIRKVRLSTSGKKRHYINLKCRNCGKVWNIHVNNIGIYTEEVRKNFVGLCCKYRRITCMK